MSNPFVAEIRMFGFNFAPKGWALCNGQLLPLSQNTALFALLGVMYGGNGKSNFALPDLQGNAAMHQGQGSGLSERYIGEVGGASTVTLLQSEMPIHNHRLVALAADANTDNPTNAVLAQGNWSFQGNGGVVAMYSDQAPNAMMNPQSLAIVGSSQPHNNMQPYLTLNFCIALQGVFPPRP